MGDLKVYRTVHRSTKGIYNDSPIDLAQIRRNDKLKAAQEATIAHNEKVMEQFEKEQHTKKLQNAMFASESFANKKYRMMDLVTAKIGDRVAEAAFAHIYIKSLPHDKEFIVENFNTLNMLGSWYMRKLGGLKYLKTMESTSPFLRKFYNVCSEATKKAVKKRIKTISKAVTDDDIYENIKGQISDDEKGDLLDEIDNLGADELAMLVQQKIISVVKDENNREKEAKAIRSDLKNDLIPSEDADADISIADNKKVSSDDTTDDGDVEDDTTEENFNPFGVLNTGDLQQTIERWDPVKENFNYNRNNRPASLFYAITTDIARDMILYAASKEGAEIVPPVKRPYKNMKDSPVNLDIFADYIQDKANNVSDMWKGDAISKPIVIGSSGNSIDKERVLTEAVMQYGLLETAHTMKLINPSVKEIRQQADYLMGI